VWSFGKVEWKTAMMPLEFVDDAGDLDAMMISFEAVGNPDGQTRYFSAHITSRVAMQLWLSMTSCVRRFGESKMFK
jgi:hypothetical protein